MNIKRIGRNILLDYVRGIACILIVLYHYTQRYLELFQNSDNWSFRLSWGYMAVATFFLLAGYLAAKKDESNTKLLEYIKHKVFRLFPAYWASIPITFFVTCFWLPSRKVSIFAAVFNFTMLESFVGVALVDGAYWTLANELVFYAFIAFVVIILKKRDKLPFFCLAWILALTIFHFAETDTLLSAAIGKIVAKQYGHMFAAGVSLKCFLQKNERYRVIAGLTLILSIGYQMLTFGMGYTLFYSISLLIVGVCAFANNKGFVLNNKIRRILYPLEFIAGISYPLYLLHQNIGYAVLENLRPLITESEWIIIIPFFVVIILAYAIHKYIEIPVAKKYSGGSVIYNGDANK